MSLGLTGGCGSPIPLLLRADWLDVARVWDWDQHPAMHLASRWLGVGGGILLLLIDAAAGGVPPCPPGGIRESLSLWVSVLLPFSQWCGRKAGSSPLSVCLSVYPCWGFQVAGCPGAVLGYWGDKSSERTVLL